MRTIKKNIHWIVAVLILGVFAKHIFILHNIFHFDWEVTLYDAGISTVILSTSVWGIVLLVRAYPTTAAITLYSLFVALIVSALTSVLQYEILSWWIDDPATIHYNIWLRQTLPLRFLIIWIFDTWVATIVSFRKNMVVLDKRFRKQTDASALLKEAELFKLRQQLQPHFLYNSLNSISALIQVSPERAQDMIGKLSDFLRSSVKRESEETVPLEEELRFIRSYLSIESVRFGDRLDVVFEQDDAEHSKIPPFLLQPLIENAIKFGLYGNTGKVRISIKISGTSSQLTISISNPYDPDIQPPKGTGFGLKGVKRRLYLLYARNDLLITQKDGKNFTTILKIPQQHVQGNID